jgi:SAM-dependent methyltransferase
MRVRATLEHMIAVTYGVTYDAVVTRFGPYEAMIAEIVGFVGRSVPATDNPRAIKVLDIACGIGNVGLRLARAGYSVVAIDAVRHLIAIAREKHHGAGGPTNLTFQHADLAHDPLPGAGGFDVLVSMNTLYWHAAPEALLAACRRALKPGGHAVFLTYGRPARVVRTFREVCAAQGPGAAAKSLRRRCSSASATASTGTSARRSSMRRSRARGSRSSRRIRRSSPGSAIWRGSGPEHEETGMTTQKRVRPVRLLVEETFA